jgi:hypothetical protein
MCVKLGLAAGAARFERFSRIAAMQDLKRHPVTKELQESIQAFRAMDAEIELQPILDIASRELREAGSGNIPTVGRQGMKTGVDYRANDNARLISRAFANVSRFL